MAGRIYPALLADGEMMHYVYVLQSTVKNNYLYIGNTNDLQRRLKEHNKGCNPSTRDCAPLGLVYYEAYRNKEDAINREYKLKHHGSVIGHLKKRLKKSLLDTTQKGGV